MAFKEEHLIIATHLELQIQRLPVSRPLPMNYVVNPKNPIFVETQQQSSVKAQTNAPFQCCKFAKAYMKPFALIVANIKSLEIPMRVEEE